MSKKKSKYSYRRCPYCGKNARYDLATIYVELPDGRSVGVPDIPAINCKKCNKIALAEDERSKIKEYVDAVLDKEKQEDINTDSNE